MFGDLLKELRTKKGVSQVELAKAIGVSNGNVGDWERGRSKPGYDALIALSRFFEISADQLLGLHSSVVSHDLTENEKEVLDLLHRFDERSQLKFIGKIEVIADEMSSATPNAPKSANG